DVGDDIVRMSPLSNFIGGRADFGNIMRFEQCGAIVGGKSCACQRSVQNVLNPAGHVLGLLITWTISKTIIREKLVLDCSTLWQPWSSLFSYDVMNWSGLLLSIKRCLRANSKYKSIPRSRVSSIWKVILVVKYSLISAADSGTSSRDWAIIFSSCSNPSSRAPAKSIPSICSTALAWAIHIANTKPVSVKRRHRLAKSKP